MMQARSNGQQGQAVILFALLMVGMVGMLGLIVDGGMLLAERRGTQNAADGAAAAAAYDMMRGRDSTTATTSALHYAARNGYNNDGSTNAVRISIPPTSGSHAGDNSFVQVVITKTLSTFFVHYVFGGTSAVTTSSTGGITRIPNPYAIISLNSTACNSFQSWGNGQLDVNGGGILVNSSCTTSAFNAWGNVNVVAAQGGAIDVVGGYQISGSATISPIPTSGVVPTSDPLAGVPAPSFSGLTVRNGTAAAPSTLQIPGNDTLTLHPGIYYGGINISGSPDITLESGTYIMAGGGFKFTGGGRIRGEHVFFYNTQDPTNPTGDGAYGPIYLSGSGRVQLTPPESGDYEGMLFFQDRNNTQPFTSTGNNVADDHDKSTEGTLYFPSATCNTGGNAHEAETSQVICDKVNVSGNGNVVVRYETEKFFAAPNGSLVE